MKLVRSTRSRRLKDGAVRFPGGKRPPRHPGRGLATVGLLVLLLGTCGAGAWYWQETRHPQPTMDELLPGYSRANSRQMGLFYGKLGVLMWEWREGLTHPGTQAVLIAVAASLLALACFRVAWLRGQDSHYS